MENKTYVELQVPDSSAMNAYISLPETTDGKKLGIIVVQEAFGVNSHIKRVTDKFAAEGYVAIAPEFFHRTAPSGFQGDYNNFDSVAPHIQGLTNQHLADDLKAAYEWLISQDNVDPERIFCVGYCMGGRAAFIANTALPLKAAVSYYGGRMDSALDLVKNIHGKHLFFWGGLDKHIPKEQIDRVTQAMTDAGKDYVNVVFSKADHGFNSDDRSSFNAAASSEAWTLTFQFLKNA
ncbi:dienelactone hydrolase family protein [Mucilaginibacter sp. RS28]|uniref:Dienelactone hydrolase family protein n=1 Tax=Mucilaginibacter straminoryzae TaxID=2932774 RepID=A0A9X2B7M5_9SPHI|nr:dienelactone hydrolase family protein [Mucilaginibacter straminoryzae]MCJ8208739.1 dienelactone hydrolase family protein [Mucilaginibacter straminoryzae]